MPVFYLDHKYYDSFTYLNILQNDFIGNYEFDFGDMPYVKVDLVPVQSTVFIALTNDNLIHVPLNLGDRNNN